MAKACCNMSVFFTQHRTVLNTEIDDLQHVNNVVYVQWIQDIADAHWKHLTKKTPIPNIVWVVLRHEIDYLKQAILGDTITLKTWVGDTRGATSIRHVEIVKGDLVLVKAKTTWCLLEAQNFKPKRITESVLNVLLPSK